ncbi:UDP-3-O-(3-hydroxymyristoyl)glucosamine N-acyltransferase [Pollutimonas harenae]|uniref:UDP-3-O-acylglucosamine N-acyltransferase n=1 Tax=Pollutimonas harenae TaxID=657015 RepID=A0A853GVA6_9BURK|nr:UDP-3-O-(3-hydroxymyristoyl)glucosamine N-acyltransferase [Pollutimonas harenae]NYT86067.1 UDP-3-O-(3-hydroxymyristoyl)glucosamine N-acyltransferase [Pollutimonas harenae]TEA71114.1 UDP-3-O-(3-hydroxymyristoyl)glucosamine N-acyltransferase [Pollutimonas harenae]
MPVLLAPEQAPTLQTLLAEANVAGLDCIPVETKDKVQPRIRGLGSLLSAGPDEISFLSNPRMQAQLPQSGAAVVILTPTAFETLKAESYTFLPVLCSEPYLMYALLAQWFDRHRINSLPAGIHESAVIAPTAQIEPGVAIGPHCVIEDGVRIGRGTRLGPGCIIGANSILGADCLLHGRVTLYHHVVVGDRAILHSGCVLGADGFGFAPDPRQESGAWAKIAQIGGVVLGNDVEIGANTTVDRGAIDNTIIGNGVKLDNQIMIGHNCQIGDHTAMAACVGVAGSTIIGKRCSIGGAAMLSGHLNLADDVNVSGGTAITSSISHPGRYTGVYPYAEHIQWQRNAAVLPQLATLRRRIRALEKQES